MRRQLGVEADSELDERGQTTRHPDRAGVGAVDAGEDLQQRALPGAVAPDDAEELTPADVEGDPVERAQLAEVGAGERMQRALLEGVDPVLGDAEDLLEVARPRSTTGTSRASASPADAAAVSTSAVTHGQTPLEQLVDPRHHGGVERALPVARPVDASVLDPGVRVAGSLDRPPEAADDSFDRRLHGDHVRGYGLQGGGRLGVEGVGDGEQSRPMPSRSVRGWDAA